MVTNDKQKLYIEFSQRLNVACDDLGWPSSGRGNRTVKLIDRLPDELKVSRTAANKWFNGEGMPESVKIGRISNILGVAQEWLTTGEGPKYVISLKTEHIESKAEVYQPNLTQTPPKWLKSLTEKVGNLNYTPTDEDVDTFAAYCKMQKIKRFKDMEIGKVITLQNILQNLMKDIPPENRHKYESHEVRFEMICNAYKLLHEDDPLTEQDKEYIHTLIDGSS